MCITALRAAVLFGAWIYIDRDADVSQPPGVLVPDDPIHFDDAHGYVECEVVWVASG